MSIKHRDMRHSKPGTPTILIQIRKESTLRALTGFNKALAITLQKVQGGTLVKVGVQDWTDQIAVGAVGLALHPLLITAAVGAATEYNVVHEILGFIDQSIRQEQPSVLVGFLLYRGANSILCVHSQSFSLHERSAYAYTLAQHQALARRSSCQCLMLRRMYPPLKTHCLGASHALD